MRPVTVSVTRGSSALPRVATEIFWRERSMVMASREGSLLNASTTERARQADLSGGGTTGGSLVRLITLSVLMCNTGQRAQRRENWGGEPAAQICNLAFRQIAFASSRDLRQCSPGADYKSALQIDASASRKFMRNEGFLRRKVFHFPHGHLVKKLMGMCEAPLAAQRIVAYNFPDSRAAGRGTGSVPANRDPCESDIVHKVKTKWKPLRISAAAKPRTENLSAGSKK